MNSSSPMPSDRATADPDQVAEPPTVYRKYVAGSAAAYRRYLRPAATRAADAYQRHVRPAAARAAAAAATAAYRKYVEKPAAAQEVGPSMAERAAAAAAESAAAYERYVSRPAAIAEEQAGSPQRRSPAV
jgi:hypothetical protein